MYVSPTTSRQQSTVDVAGHHCMKVCQSAWTKSFCHFTQTSQWHFAIFAALLAGLAMEDTRKAEKAPTQCFLRWTVMSQHQVNPASSRSSMNTITKIFRASTILHCCHYSNKTSFGMSVSLVQLSVAFRLVPRCHSIPGIRLRSSGSEHQHRRVSQKLMHEQTFWSANPAIKAPCTRLRLQFRCSPLCR